MALGGSLSRQEKQQSAQRHIVQTVSPASTPWKSAVLPSDPHRGH
jgi:hypothetical protein